MALRYNFNMAAPIFIQLTPDEDAQLQQLLNNPNTHPKVRRRALAVRLSAQHWSAPRIAQFLGCHHTTVLNDLKRWQRHRYDGLADGKAHGAPPKITSEVKAYLTALLAEDRIWTATQLQEALATQMQVQVHPATLTRHLKRMGYVYKRTRYVPAGVPEVSAVEAFCSEWEQVKRG
jgi:transposase